MFKDALKLKKLTTLNLCLMAMLVAITMALSFLSGYLRIGSMSKFNISFISVYIGGALFGPVAGGTIGALADFTSWLINPTGPFVPVFTVIEFVNGFLFGLFFYTSKERSIKLVALLALLCVLLQYGVNVIRTYFLAQMYLGGKFYEAFITRIPSTVIMASVKFAGIIILEPAKKRLKQLVKKYNSKREV
jgi:ECF transporter S component (folate family)